MGEIVSLHSTSHILFSPQAAPEQAERIYQGMKELGELLVYKEPDVILMIAPEHMFNIDLSIQPPFCIGVSDHYTPLGDLGIPQRQFRGHREFAESLVGYTAKAGFDLAKAEGIAPDHGITLPLTFIKPWGKIPVVPLYININMTPPPTPSRCLALATTLKRAIEEARPEHETVAVIGSGGLSHWLNIPGAGEVSEKFDQKIIDLVVSGNGHQIAEMSSKEILEQGGNGGLEVMNWMMAAAMVPGSRGRKVFYEPMVSWLTGMGGVVMDV